MMTVLFYQSKVLYCDRVGTACQQQFNVYFDIWSKRRARWNASIERYKPALSLFSLHFTRTPNKDISKSNSFFLVISVCLFSIVIQVLMQFIRYLHWLHLVGEKNFFSFLKNRFKVVCLSVCVCTFLYIWNINILLSIEYIEKH